MFCQFRMSAYRFEPHQQIQPVRPRSGQGTCGARAALPAHDPLPRRRRIHDLGAEHEQMAQALQAADAVSGFRARAESSKGTPFRKERSMSSYAREPIVNPVPIESLRPTQIAVGMHEVQQKRKELRKRKPQKIGEFIGRHMIPVILGPKKRHYVIDHHHLALALHKEGLRDVLVTVVADLSALEPDAFWAVLDHRSWVFPYDATGRRRPFADIPKSVMHLQDDPFRSLAGALRRAGGYAKDSTPFSEFLWADFLRPRIKRKAIQANFSATLKQALRFAKRPEAAYLPGWCGPHT